MLYLMVVKLQNSVGWRPRILGWVCNNLGYCAQRWGFDLCIPSGGDRSLKPIMVGPTQIHFETIRIQNCFPLPTHPGGSEREAVEGGRKSPPGPMCSSPIIDVGRAVTVARI